MHGQLQIVTDITPEKLSPALLNGGLGEFKIYLDNLGKKKFLPEM